MEREKCIEMIVAGLVLDPASNAPIVLLKDQGGDVCLPIWIGVAEATSIAAVLKEVPVVRPMTHDLMKTAIEEFGGKISRIFICDLRENTFFAEIEVEIGNEKRLLDSRPSDAIALAIRFGAQILVAESVLTQAQVAIVSSDPSGDPTKLEGLGGEKDARSVDFTNIEREKWSKILAEMDPEDFKYKM